MKYISVFWSLLLLTLCSCGQTAQKKAVLSAEDTAKLKYYEQQSIFYKDKKPDSAVYFADKGLKLSRNLNYLSGQVIMLDQFVSINEYYGNIKLAVKYQKSILKISNSLHDEVSIINETAKLGLLEGKAGNLKTGIRLISSTLNEYEQRRDTAGLVKANVMLGALHELNKDRSTAMTYYMKAEKLNRGFLPPDEYFSLINNIGKLHAKNGVHEAALKYYEKGIEQSTKSEDTKAHIAFLNQAGASLDTLGNKTKALEYHQQALQKAKMLGMYEEQARSLMGIAKVLKNKDADLSINHLKNALTIAHAIGNKYLSAEIYYSLSESYLQQSRYEQAIHALEAHHRLLDSLLNADKNHKINALQSSYELAESRLHVENLELANLQKTYQRNAGMILAAAIFIILLILTFYFYKSNRLNKELEASNHIKDRLFAIIGHDLRNPIGSITELLAMMEKDRLTPDEQRYMITEMRKQGDISLEILNALLSWGTAQLNGIQLNPSAFHTKNIITKNIIALQGQASDKQITVDDKTSPSISIFGDPDHFDFIIRNLISNAIKFSPGSGSVEINADINKLEGQVVFSVTDHGKGISFAQQQLFKTSGLDISFGTNGEKGTGIGLMLSKQFIKANQGAIWIESEEGKGATFYFSFKLG